MQNDQARFGTRNFKKNVNTISQYFEEVDLKNKIEKRHIVLDKDSTIKFLKIISPYVPKFMYKEIFVEKCI